MRTIFQFELTEFNQCLGSAFKTELESYLIDYSSVSEYDCSKFYKTGNVVRFGGVLYEAITTVLDNEMPPNYLKWKLAPKFNLDCVDQFWCTFLGEYLSLSVVLGILPQIRTQITAEGAIQKVGDHFTPASDKAYEHLYASFLGRKDNVFANMVRFVKAEIKKVSGECLDFYNTLKFIGINCCGDCGCSYYLCLCDDECSDSRMLYEVG